MDYNPYISWLDTSRKWVIHQLTNDRYDHEPIRTPVPYCQRRHGFLPQSFMQLSDRSLRFRDDILELPGVFYLEDGLPVTLPETNSNFAPENGWLEYDRLSYWVSAYFQGQAVSFRECKWLGSSPVYFSHL